MLRISITKPNERSAILLIEGHLQGVWIDELKAACERLLEGGQEVSIDLAGVSLVDRTGFELLVSLTSRSVQLVHCSPFQAEQLRRISVVQPEPNVP